MLVSLRKMHRWTVRLKLASLSKGNNTLRSSQPISSQALDRGAAEEDHPVDPQAGATGAARGECGSEGRACGRKERGAGLGELFGG